MQDPHTYATLMQRVENCTRPILVWDIETGPQSDEDLRALFNEDSIKLPKKPERFKRSAVKTDHLKDPQKIEDKIEAAKATRAREHREWTTKCKTVKEMAFETFVDNAMSKADTGRIVAVGYRLYNPDTRECHQLNEFYDDEDVLLDHNLALFKAIIGKRGLIVGHNIHGFDVPFLTQRCWIKGMQPPFGLRRGYVDDDGVLVDTMRRWFLGERNKYISLNQLCRIFRIRGKYSEIDGKYFAKALAETPVQAVRYLTDDMRCTYEVARKLRIF
jgi:hypothetical protein